MIGSCWPTQFYNKDELNVLKWLLSVLSLIYLELFFIYSRFRYGILSYIG